MDIEQEPSQTQQDTHETTDETGKDVASAIARQRDKTQRMLQLATAFVSGRRNLGAAWEHEWIEGGCEDDG